MQYRIVKTNSEDQPIEHALFGKKGGAQKGSTWDNHKYIARQKAGDTWRYFYSQAELAAAKAKQAGQKVANQAKAGVAKVKKSVTDTKRYASDVNNTRNRYKEAINREQKRVISAQGRQAGASFNAGQYQKEYLPYTMKAIRGGKLTNKEKEHEDTFRELQSKEINRSNNAVEAEKRAMENVRELKKAANDYEKTVDKTKYGISTALNKVDNAIDKGKSITSKFLSDAKSVTSDAVDKGKEFAKKAGLAVSDTASKAVGAVATQIDLAKNAKREASAQINMNADAKQKKAALDEANEKLALIRKDRKENPYKHVEGVWDLHEEIARDKIKKAQYQYNLADTVATQYEPEGKTSYDWFDSDVGGRKIERTSEQRQNDIKLQNRYKYDREYREQIDSERAAAVKKYEQLTAQFETLYNKESEAEKKYGRNSDEYKALNKKTMDLLYKVEDARDDVFNYDVIRAKTMK